MLRRGLIPYWAKDIKAGFANINAKAEGIESKPAFRKAFERRRCLVPVDNFYEWRRTAIGKQPSALAFSDRGIMARAGLWENWHSPAGEWVRSFAIVTTVPNQLCAEIHNRMPVILKPDAWPAWLGEEPADEPQLKSLLTPYPSDDMICWPVSPRVGDCLPFRQSADHARGLDPNPVCGRDGGRRPGRARIGLIVRPDRDLDDGPRDGRRRRRRSACVSRQFSPRCNWNGVLGPRHRRAGFGDT